MKTQKKQVGNRPVKNSAPDGPGTDKANSKSDRTKKANNARELPKI